MGRQGTLDLYRDKNGQRRGGARKGAGRPCAHERPSEPHKRRRAFSPTTPIHVVTRVMPRVGSLRRRDLYTAIREATIAIAKHEDARIVHLSIQRTHVHLIVEAKHKAALATGMQSFLISAARHINRAVGGRGCVFRDRYHTTVLASPRQVRACIAYVLNNWRRHLEDRGRSWKLDPFSSGVLFGGWKERYRPPRGYRPLVVWQPKTWLLSAGWRKHGLISELEVPQLKAR
jgi:putative transposase